MKKIIYLLLCFVVSGYLDSAIAKNLGDLQFPDTVKIAGTDTSLQLNGVGYRTKFFFKIYAGALYTEKKVTGRDSVLALKGPDRVEMYFIYGEVDRDKLVSAWNEGFEENNSVSQLKVLQPEINQFNAMFPTLKKGDIVLLDYIPGIGTRVTIKGKVQGVIKGENFHAALLNIWLGDNPVDEDLKDAMLGRTDDSDD